jgi:hypothetical protein
VLGGTQTVHGKYREKVPRGTFCNSSNQGKTRNDHSVDCMHDMQKKIRELALLISNR